jgi:hypothetical protein
MIKIEELQVKLMEFSDKFELKQNALESCLESMKNCINDNVNGLGGFSIDELRLEFIEQNLVFEHYVYNVPFIKTKIGLYMKEENKIYVRNLKPIGYYELDTDTTVIHSMIGWWLM